MKRLNLYIASNLLVSTLIGIGVLTFVMLAGSLFKAFELISRGVSLTVLGKFMGYMLPYFLQFTLPLALLCATVLVFSRMSADNEISAMRASGISLWQIIAPGLILAATFSAICLYLQTDVAPESYYRAKQLKSSGNVKNPMAFIEPGRYVHFPNHVIYVGDRVDTQIRNVQIYSLNKKGNVEEDISAPRGTVDYNEHTAKLTMNLQDAVICMTGRNKGNKNDIRHAAGNLTYAIDYDKLQSREDVARDPERMSLGRLLSTVYIYNNSDRPTAPLYIELHTRLSLAFVPVAFFLIGIPFGIRTRRSETSIGIVVSLILAVIFYLFLPLAESFQDFGSYHPEILVWVPNVLYQVGGLYALRRIART